MQLDGSFHAWLEGRGPGGCLMNMVDDATGTTLCRLGKEETIWAAVGVLKAWIERYGVPQALYTDWKNVYVREPNAGERRRGEVPVTQFGRMCQALGIEIWAASSPQAKGRVERNHGTHQDRLVKKLRRKAAALYLRLRRWREAPGSCPSLCAAGTVCLGTRPETPGPCGLSANTKVLCLAPAPFNLSPPLLYGLSTASLLL